MLDGSPLSARGLYPNEVYLLGSGPGSVALGDLNGDGESDVVAANAWGDDVSVLLGAGGGRFVPSGNHPTGDVPSHMALAYLDGSGDPYLDVVTCDLRDDAVSVLRGNGDGSFQVRTSYAVGWSPHQVAVGDVNGDGRADLATSSRMYGQNGVWLLLGRDDGTFAAAVRYDCPILQGWALALGDLDDDGRDDVVAAGMTGGLMVFAGQADGSLRESFALEEYESSYQSVVLADFNEDGRLDVALGDTNDSSFADDPYQATVQVLTGRGDGTLADPVSFRLGIATETGDLMLPLAAGDVTGDGHPDLVAAYTNQTVSLLAGRGDGTFGSPTLLQYTVSDLALGDLDGDGDRDLVLVNEGGSALPVLNPGTGVFPDQQFLPAAEVMYTVAVADLDGDGNRDLVGLADNNDWPVTSSVLVYLAAGDRHYGAPQAFPAGRGAHDLAVADFNGDGVPDVAVTNADTSEVKVLLGRGDGSLASPTSAVVGSRPYFLVAGDLDGNGRDDLVVYNGGETTLSVLVAKPEGGFQWHTKLTTGAGAPALADLDGDGHLDLVTLHTKTARQVVVRRGTGQGTFLPPVTYDVGALSGTFNDPPAVGDITGDGIPDLVVNSDGGSLIALVGRGDGTLAVGPLVTLGFPVGDQALQDVNGDGTADLIVSGSWGSTFWIALSRGDGTFAAGVPYATAYRADSLAVADLDGDALADVVTTGRGGSAVATVYHLDMVRHQPAGPTAGPVSTLRVEFPGAMDPGSFSLAGDVREFAGPAGPLAALDYAWVDANTLQITFRPQGVLGEYRMVLGPDIRDAAGRPLDLDRDGTAGEDPDDRYTATFRVTPPRVVAVRPQGPFVLPFDRLAVTFDRPMEPTSFGTEDVLSLTGPAGVIRPTAVTWTDARTAQVRFPPQAAPGAYAVVIGPDILDRAGNRLDQDADGTPGEAADDRFAAQFVLALPFTQGTLGGDTTWAGGPILVGGVVTVPAGVTLTIGAGTVVKFAEGAGLDVAGALRVNGTPAAPVALTSLRDDAAGGDSNGDGAATAPLAGDWRSVRFLAGSTGTLDHAEVAYGGNSVVNVWGLGGMVEVLGGAGVTLEGGVLRESLKEGLVGGGTTVLRNSLLVSNDRGVNAFLGGHTEVVNCTLDDNRIGLVWHGGDLVVGNSLVTGSLQAGVLRDLGGGSLGVSHTDVSNPGASQGNFAGVPDPTGTGGNLSADPLYFNPGSRQYQLRRGSPAVDAGSSAGAPDTDFQGQPRRDDPHAADTGTGDRPWFDLGAFERQPALPPALDLAAADVAGPAAGMPGERVTVTWAMQNVGGTVAPGPWSDAVYLSADTAWTPDDVRLGEARHADDLGTGLGYTASAEVTLPGVLPGPYYFLARPNDRHELAEGAGLANNAAASARTVALDLPALAAGTPRPDAWAPGAAAGAGLLYRLSVPEGSDLVVDLEGPAGSVTELYLRRGDVPTPYAFDARGAQPGLPRQSVAVSGTGAGDLYVLARATELGAVRDFTLTARLRGFGLDGVTPAAGSRAGRVTLGLAGAGFTAGTTVRLIDSGGRVLEAVAVHRIDTGHLAATFDLAAAAPGVADVEVTRPGGATARLAGGFEVTAGEAGWLEASVRLPARVRVGRPYEVVIEYRNAGQTDLVAPVLWLDHDPRLDVGFTPESVGPVGRVSLLAVNPAGPAGILPPGAGGRITLYARGNDAGSYGCAVTVPRFGGPMDWAGLAESLRPEGMADGQWLPLLGRVRANVGETWEEFAAVVARDAALLPAGRGRAWALADVFALEYERARGDLATSLRGRVLREGDGLPLGDVTVRVQEVSLGTGRSAVSLTDGTFLIPDLPAGTYRVGVDRPYLGSAGEVVVGGAGVSGLDVVVRRGADLAGRVVAAADGSPLADALVVALGEGDGEAASAVTDLDGRFVLTGLPPGSYEVRAAAAGYAPAGLAGVAVGDPAGRPVSLVLVTEGTVAGTITGPQGPVAGAAVWAAGGGTAGSLATADAVGKYVLAGLVPGQAYQVTAEAAGLIRTWVDGVYVPSGAAVTGVDLALAPGGTVQGTLTRAGTGAAAGGVEVVVEGRQESSWAVSDAAGQYVLGGLPAGRYTVTFGGDSWMTAAEEVDVVPGSVTRVDRTLAPRGTIRGTVVNDANGLPIAKVPVQVLDAEGQATLVVTDAAGAFAVTSLDAGDYRVILGDLSSPGVAAVAVTVAAAAGDVTADLHTAVAGVVSGAVYAADGATPVPDALVALKRGDAVITTMTTDDAGRYALVVIADGVYGVEAVADDRLFPALGPVTLAGGAVVAGQDFVAGQDEATGAVHQAGSGLAVAGATVTLQPLEPRLAMPGILTAVTDASGTFTLSAVLPGIYRVQAATDGLAAVPQTVVLTPGQPLDLSVQVGATLSGAVTDAATGAALGGALVSVVSPAWPDLAWSTTVDGAGRYQVGPLPAGSYTAVAVAGGRVAQGTGLLVIGPGEAVARDFALAASATGIAGRVVGPGGPLDRARVWATEGGGGVVAAALTGGDGTYALTSLPPGLFTVHAAAVGFAPSATGGIALADGDQVGDLTLTLAPAAVSDLDYPSDDELQDFSSLPWTLGPSQFRLTATETENLKEAAASKDPLLRARAEEISTYRVEVNRLLKVAEETFEQTVLPRGSGYGTVAKHMKQIQGLVQAADALRVDVAYCCSRALKAAAAAPVRQLREALEEIARAQSSQTLFVDDATIRRIRKWTGEGSADDLRRVFSEYFKAAAGVCRPDQVANLGVLWLTADGIMDRLEQLNRSQGLKTREALGNIEEYQKSCKPYYEALRRLNAMLDDLSQSLGHGPGQAPGGTSPLPAAPGATARADHGRAKDPNDKVGPAAAGAGNFLRPGLMGFEVLFENDPASGATAAAQVVEVTDVLDADLDLDTFAFGPFGFGDLTFAVPPGLAHYETTLDLRPRGIDLLVPVVLDLDRAGRTLTAVFGSLDPLTRQPPDDPDAGFLPVNDKAVHNGEGFFSYSVRPPAGLPTGTVITNRASIVFDDNPAITTPETRHALDARPPTSTVDPLPAVVSTPAIAVTWSSADDPGGSGVVSTSVFVSTDGGPLLPWLAGTTDPGAVYAGTSGHSYGFASLATDAVGQQSPPPAAAQVTVRVAVPPPPPSPPGDPDEAWVTELYGHVLGRAPDAGGMQFWLAALAAGATRAVVARGFWESAEHRGRQVDEFYERLLHRPADPEGRAYWTRVLRDGGDEAVLAAGLLSSAEYRALYPGLAALVEATYRDGLGRPADVAGRAYWEGVGLNPASGPWAIGEGVVRSPEYQVRRLTDDYVGYLHRVPEGSGLRWWQSALAHGLTTDQMAAAILASDEFFALASGT